MTNKENVICFGGPLNERVLPVDCRMDHLHAPMPVRVWCDPMVDGPAEHRHFRTVRYDIKKIGAVIGGDACVWRVAVAQGFPEQRITGAVDVVLAMCRLPLLAWLAV